MYEARRRRPLTLSERDRTVLEIERKWGAGPTSQQEKLDEARERLELSASGYSLVLRSLIDDPAALEYDRETISRLRAVRDLHSGAGWMLPGRPDGHRRLNQL